MTVDSKYILPTLYENDGGTEYPYPYESIGLDAARLVVVAANGDETVLIKTVDYQVKYSEYRGEVPYRGTIRLKDPVPAGSRLRVERKTPITQTIDFTSKELLDPNQVEYALDKICFIEQEIEGHFCDCRGPVVVDPVTVSPPGTDPPVIPPECIPYACDALEGVSDWLFLTENDDLSEFFPYDAGDVIYTETGSGATAISDVSDLAGQAVSVNLLGIPDNRPLGNFIDPCGGESRVFVGGNTNGTIVALGDQVPTTSHSFAYIGGPSVNDEPRYGTGSGLTQITGTSVVTYENLGNGQIVQLNPVTYTLYVRLAYQNPSANPPTGLQVQAYRQTSGAGYTVGPEVLGTIDVDEGFYYDDFHFVTGTISFVGIVDDVYESTVVPGRFHPAWVWKHTVSVKVFNRAAQEWQTFTFSKDVPGFAPQTYIPESNPEGLASGLRFISMVNTNTRLASLLGSNWPLVYWRAENIPIDSLFLAWERNKSTYTPPETC